MKQKLVTLLFTLACSAVVLQSYAADKNRAPGFVDFNNIKAIRNMSAEVDITVNGWLMGLVGQAAKESGEKDLDWMRSIDSVRVKVIPLSAGDDTEILTAAEKVVDSLIDDGWENVVTVKERGENVNVFVLGDGERLTGVTIVVVEAGDEAVFVNLSGSISSEHLAALMRGAKLPGLDLGLNLKIENEG